MSSDYNKGTADDRREALKGALTYISVITTLATGTVVLSATFLDKFYSGHELPLLEASWILLGLSVVAGLVGIGDYVNQFAESTLKVRRTTIEFASFFQWLFLVAGVVLFAMFVVANVSGHPGVEVASAEASPQYGQAKATIVCPASTSTGCSGTVTFGLRRPQGGKSISLGTAAFATEHPGVLTVSAPLVVARRLRWGLRRDKLEIVVRAQSHYGGAQTVTREFAAVMAHSSGE